VRFPGATYLVVGFEHEGEARRFLADLRQRMETFALSLHPDKTRRSSSAALRRRIEHDAVLVSRRRSISLDSPISADAPPKGTSS